jgi:hypothetical protein
MQFVSITEYFYKFFSTLLLIILLPIISFIALYLQPGDLETEIEKAPIPYVTYSVFTLVVWAVTFIFFNKKIKSVRNRQGLRQKLEKYFQLTIVRYSALSLSGLVLATGFYFLRNDFFTAFFLVLLFLVALIWPTTRKVCSDLKLRGDEREMVFYKKDKFQN